jgi:uncharacterized protein (TIGR03083 family)
VLIVSPAHADPGLGLAFRCRIVPFMPPSRTYAALSAEAAAVCGAAARIAEADVSLPSPCPPWTVAGLLCHVVIATDRVGAAIEAGGGTHGELVTARGYYRPGERFSAGVNADRIDIAAALAARLGTAAAIAAELDAACTRILALLAAAPAGQVVRTRHGDRMLLSEFAITRLAELGLHGLDLAIALGREPWLTAEAAAVLEDLLLPAGGPAPAQVAERLGCDRAGVIARLTGRVATSPDEQAGLTELGVAGLVLG